MSDAVLDRPKGSDAIPASDLFFCAGQMDEAIGLVRQFHYSKREPSNIVFAGTLHEPGGLFGDFGPAIAAALFSFPPTRWSENVLELTRLVRRNGCRVPLTRLISLSCARLKKHGYDLLVSYADETQGHHGGVYQAASWHYHGQRSPANDGVFINGKYFPGRTCNTKWGTRSPNKLRALLGCAVEPHCDAGKHLYWRNLTRSGKGKAVRLGLKNKAYPKNLGKKG